MRSNATKRPIRGRELIKVRDLFKEIRYVTLVAATSGPGLHKEIPPPPLKRVEHVMNNLDGTDVASLRNLATALARDAIFGKEEMVKTV